MFRYLVLTLAILLNGAIAMPEDVGDDAPAVKVINFTADWCPNCQILNPRMADAIERFEKTEVARIDLDHTRFKGASKASRIDLTNQLLQQMATHEAIYLWDWYGGRTGIAVVISADNGEPLTCLNRSMSVDQIADRVRQSVTLATKAPPGMRRPEGPECPPPMN